MKVAVRSGGGAGGLGPISECITAFCWEMNALML